MQCLTESETSSWLDDNDVTPVPYGNLYLPNDLVTIYNWEGDLYDAWSGDLATFNSIEGLSAEVSLFGDN